jgi:hypothetical protein
VGDKWVGGSKKKQGDRKNALTAAAALAVDVVFVSVVGALKPFRASLEHVHSFLVSIASPEVQRR